MMVDGEQCPADGHPQGLRASGGDTTNTADGAYRRRWLLTKSTSAPWSVIIWPTVKGMAASAINLYRFLRRSDDR